MTFEKLTCGPGLLLLLLRLVQRADGVEDGWRVLRRNVVRLELGKVFGDSLIWASRS